MFLRHLHDKFHYLVLLEVNPETSVKRKIERDLKKGVERDSKVTSDMVTLIEYPAMEHYNNEYSVNNGIVLDTNDFGSIH